LGGFTILDFRFEIDEIPLKPFTVAASVITGLKSFAKAGCSGIYKPFLFNQIKFIFLHT